MTTKDDQNRQEPGKLTPAEQKKLRQLRQKAAKRNEERLRRPGMPTSENIEIAEQTAPMQINMIPGENIEFK